MAYSVGVERRAQKQIARLIPAMRDRVEAALRFLANDPRPPGSRELQGPRDVVCALATTESFTRWTTNETK